MVNDELDSKSTIVTEIAAGKSKTNGMDTRRVIPVSGDVGMTSLTAITSGFPGPKSPQNPWKSNTLEWTAPVERIHGNWPGEIPEVHRWAYDYSKPGAEEDFIPQTEPLKEGEIEY